MLVACNYESLIGQPYHVHGELDCLCWLGPNPITTQPVQIIQRALIATQWISG
jgi:hypothetical protein